MTDVRDSEAFWNWRAKKYSSRNDVLKAVLYENKWRSRYEDFMERRALQRVLKISSGLKVLDVGCGAGRWLVRFAREGADVTGIDYSPEMINVVRKRCQEESLKADLQVTKALEIDTPDKSFDVVIAIVTLLHVIDGDELTRTIRELTRVTKIKGKVIVIDYFCDPEPIPRRGKLWIHRNSAELINLFNENGANLIEKRGVRMKNLTEKTALWLGIGASRSLDSAYPRLDGKEIIKANIPLARRIYSNLVWLENYLFIPLNFILPSISGFHKLAFEKLLVFERKS